MKYYFIILILSAITISFAQEAVIQNKAKIQYTIALQDSATAEIDEPLKIEDPNIIADVSEKDFDDMSGNNFEVFDDIEKYTFIDKNKLVASTSFGLLLNEYRESKNTLKTFEIPSVSYKFEIRPKSVLKFYGYADAGYDISRHTYDGEAAEGEDCYNTDMYLILDPALKIMIKEVYFLKLNVPFSFDNITPQVEDADSYNTSSLNITPSLGYDSRSIDKHMFSPWDQFEKGILTELKFTSGLFYSKDGESQDELTSNFSMLISYAKLSEKYNFMIKPWLSYTYEMNDKIVDPAWFTAGIFAAWDYKMDFNMNGYLDVQYGQFDMDNDTDLWGTETFLQGGIELNYYLINELDLFTDITFNKLLFADKDDVDVDGNGIQSDDMEIFFKLGLKYTKNFLR